MTILSCSCKYVMLCREVSLASVNNIQKCVVINFMPGPLKYLEPAISDQTSVKCSKDGISKDGASKDGASKDGASKDGACKDGASKDGASNWKKEGMVTTRHNNYYSS